MDIIDRATLDLGGRKTPATIDGELAPVQAPSTHSEQFHASLDAVRAEVAAALAEATPPAAVTTTIEQKHLTLSGWQKFGALIVVLGIAVGVRHGHLRLRRGTRLGLQDRRIPEGLSGRQSRAAAGRHPGVANRRTPVVTTGRARRARARFDFRAPAGKHGAQ